MPQCDHPIQRARERYGLELTGVDLRKIACMIQRNEGTLDTSKPWAPGQSVNSTWFVEYEGHKLRVVISADFYCIVTFLPYKDQWRGKQKSKAKRRRRRKVWVNGHARYAEVTA